MARLTSLQDIASSRKQISNYIITDKPSLIDSQDGTGNIVIYINDGDGANESEKSGDKYTDLYIGDEHIAGGYGLKNIDDRNAVYQMMQDVDDIKKTLDEMEQAEQGSSEHSRLQLSINPDYHTIKTSDNVYTLDLNETTGVLTVYNDPVERVYGMLVYKDADNAYNEYPKTNVAEESDSIPLNHIEFKYVGNELIERIAISLLVETGSGDTAVTNYVNVGDSTGYDVDIANDYFIATNEFMLKDPDMKPNILQQHWKLDIKENFKTFLKTYTGILGDITIRVHLITKNNTRKMTFSAGKFTFVAPIYFFNNIYNATITNPIHRETNISNVKVFPQNAGDSVELSFPQNNVKNVYNQVFIPASITKSFRPMFIMQKTGIKIPWHSFSSINTRLKNNTDMEYARYIAPYPYLTTTNTNWIVQFE